MNILIVDDEPYSVKALKERIDWDRLGLVADETIEVYTAYNAFQARDIILQKQIDIVVSDIEMPNESGIELIRWMRLQGYQAEVIIITCHAQFDYAKEAISLGVSEYSVKPIEFLGMEEQIKKLILTIKERKTARIKQELGSYWEENKSSIRNDFWSKLISAVTEEEREDIFQEATKYGIVEQKNNFKPVLIRVKRYQGNLEKWNYEKIMLAVKNIAGDIFVGNMNLSGVISVGEDIVVICNDSEELNPLEKPEKFVETAKEILHLDVCCYLGKECSYQEMHQEVSSLRVIADNDVVNICGVFREKRIKSNEESELIGIPKEFHDKLCLEKFTECWMMVHMWLSEKDFINKLTRADLIRCREAFLQVFYDYVLKRDVSTSFLLQDEHMRYLYDHACESTTHLEEWVKFILGYLEELTYQVKKENSLSTQLVNIVREYVDAHLDENLKREDIAEALHMNADYLARVYKRDTGESLIDYVSRRRIESAVLLLQTTNFSTTEIAEKTGFINGSHFSTVFKKLTGKSPRDFRKKV